MHADIDYARPFAGARWTDVVPRTQACPGLRSDVLLHAGPPFRGLPPAPVRQAAIQALLYEGMAADEQAAALQLEKGDVRLEPAQDHGVVTPLAQVVSASMPLMAVSAGGHVCYAPLVEGPPPALRFGSAAPGCRAALRDTEAWVRSAVLPLLHRQPVAIEAIVAAATRNGDDCHARTAAANEALIGQLLGLTQADAAHLRGQPAFVLPLLMAAAAAVLRGCGGAVAGLGGNGVDFGVRGRTGAGGSVSWRRHPAEAPRGPRLAGHENRSALGAIGDSAVIDFCGLGGQALAAAPLLAADWHETLPRDALARRVIIVDPSSGLVDPSRIDASSCPPIINLAILDRTGACGLIGRGIYEPPAVLFGPDTPGAAGVLS